MENLLNLGKALNKVEQKAILGGGKANLTHARNEGPCSSDSDCADYIIDHSCETGYCTLGGFCQIIWTGPEEGACG